MFVLDSLVDLADDFATSISYEYEQSIDSFNGLFFISSSPYYWKSIETYYYNFYYFRNGYYLSVHKEDGYNYYSSQPYRENEWGKYYFAKDTLIMIDFDVRNLEPKEHKYFTFRNKYVKIEDTLFYYNFNPMVISYNLKKTNSLVNNDKIVGIWKSDSLQIVCEFNENCSFIIERGIEKDTIMGSYFVYGEEIFLKTKGILGKKFTDYYNKNSPYFFGKLYYDVENDRISVYKKYEDIDEKYKLDKPNFEYNPVYENIDKGIYFIRKDTMDRITSSALSEGGYQIEFTNYETGERDGRVFEKLNEAKFTYYDEEGNSLEQWNGNTVPAYQDIHGIARDGSYDAEWINRDKYKNEYDKALLIENGGVVPTLNPNLNLNSPTGGDGSKVANGVMGHGGNSKRQSLTYKVYNEDTGEITVKPNSEGCSTFENGNRQRFEEIIDKLYEEEKSTKYILERKKINWGN